MEIIYVDSLFLLNLIIDYLLLVMTMRLCSLPIRRLRCLVSAAAGGLYAVACFLPGMDYLNSGIFKLALWVIMSLIAFGGEEYLFKCAISFFTISAVFGGGVWAAGMLTGGSANIYPDMGTLIFSFAVCYAFLSLSFALKMRWQGGEKVRAEIYLRQKRAELLLLHDSGNFLREHISGKKVLVVGAADIAPLFTPAETEALCIKDGIGALQAISGISGAPKFRPVFYRALGVEHALIPAFTPDELMINGEPRRDYAVAVSPTPVGSGECCGII